jgi:hypothetical protein
MHARRINRLATLLERSDEDTLYDRLPAPLRKRLRRRFIRDYDRHRGEVLQTLAARKGRTQARPALVAGAGGYRSEGPSRKLRSSASADGQSRAA